MDMKNYIELAEMKAGQQIKLAKILGVSPSNIRSAKSNQRGFPVEVCILLADYIGADRLEVIAASNLVTEKDEKKRKILESCFSVSRAANFTIAALFLAIISITSPNPANASQATISNGSYIYYVK